MRMNVKAFKKFLGLFGKFDSLMKALKSVTRGTITLTLHVEDGRKLVIPLKFTLSHDVDDVALEDEATYDSVPEGIGSVEIEHEISVVRARMYDYCLRVESQECWDDLVSELPKKMQKGYTARDLELSNMGVRAASQYGFSAHLYPMILTEAFCMDAMTAVRKNNLVQAWYCHGRAQWWSSGEVLPENPKQQGQEKARNAGNARSEKNFGWVRAEALRLIDSCAPPDGWKSAHAVAAELTPQISEFIAQESKRRVASTNLKPENLQQTLYAWMRENPELKAAFERTRKKAALR